MAYAADFRIAWMDDNQNFTITIEEVDCGAADFCDVGQPTPSLPLHGVVVRQIATHLSGAATSIDPTLSAELPLPSGGSYYANMVANGTPGTSIDNGGSAHYWAPTSILRHRSNPDAGVNNSIRTVYFCKRGWV